MRFVSVFLLLLCSISSLRAQDESWFSFKTAEVGLEGQKAFRINAVDLDNDHYPDIVLVEDIYKRGDVRIFLNRQDPSSQDPTDRVFVNWTDSSMVNVHPSLDTTKKSDVIALADVNIWGRWPAAGASSRSTMLSDASFTGRSMCLPPSIVRDCAMACTSW